MLLYEQLNGGIFQRGGVDGPQPLVLPAPLGQFRRQSLPVREDFTGNRLSKEGMTKTNWRHKLSPSFFMD